MFGLSLAKLILLVLVVLAVWYGFRWLNRAGRLRRDGAAERDRLAGAAPAPKAEDMVRCAVCDSYVPAQGARHCGRERCPYPR